MADEQNLNPQGGGQAFDPNAGFDPNFNPQPQGVAPQDPSQAGAGDVAYFDPTQAPQAPQNTGVPTQDFGYDPNAGAGGFDQGGAPAFDPNAGFAAPDPNAGFADPNAAAPQGFDPNAGFGAPVSDPNAVPGYGQDASYGAVPGAAPDPNVGGFDPNGVPGAAPAPGISEGSLDSQQPNLSQANTFEQKRSGNKGFLIGAIVAVVVLLGLAGTLIFLNLNNNNDDTTDDDLTDNTSQTDNNDDNDDGGNTITPIDEQDDETPIIDESITGGADSFASRSRKFNVAITPDEWNLRKFFVPNIDQATGECLNVSVCGPNVDPDRDGLNNVWEYNFDTDPLKADTDNDKLADGDELFVYYTAPNNDDSDADSFDDGQEVSGCFDPTKNGLGVKFGATEVGILRRNTSLQALHEPTITLLRGAGGTTEDISQIGTVSDSCDIDTSTVEEAPDGASAGDDSASGTRPVGSGDFDDTPGNDDGPFPIDDDQDDSSSDGQTTTNDSDPDDLDNAPI